MPRRFVSAHLHCLRRTCLCVEHPHTLSFWPVLASCPSTQAILPPHQQTESSGAFPFHQHLRSWYQQASAILAYKRVAKLGSS